MGTVWLPLPHWLMLPLAQNDALWQNGLAGAIPSALCFVAAGTLLFAAVRRLFDSTIAGATAAVLLALNPNLMFLQSSSMTEAVFLACLMGVLYGSVRFAESQGWWAAAGTGIAALAGTLTRYEGWFLLPFVAGYFLLVGKTRRWGAAALFSAIAGIGPLFWFAHNWWILGDPLAFYSGEYSARVIQGSTPYPGLHNWPLALFYYATASVLCAGFALAVVASIGLVRAVRRRIVWPVALLALPGVFYVWSMHSSATPIFMPVLYPYSWYNTRYGLVLLPLMVFGAAALTVGRRRAIAAAVVIAASLTWIVLPGPEHWVTFREAEVNHGPRMVWTEIAAAYLTAHRHGHATIITSSGDINGIFRRAGIPLRDTLNVDNEVLYMAPLQRPDLLRGEWAVVRENDRMRQSLLANGRYTLELRIVVKNAPVIEIYRR